MSLASKLWQRGRDLLPVTGFHFDRPIVIFQSDDWGRVGLRDREGLEQLRAAGIELGEHAYDLYTHETADDVCALAEVLKRHRDSVGRPPCLEANFLLFNLDFAKMQAEGFQRIYTLSLAEGLPEGWSRPGLSEAYREGIGDGVLTPALHGTTHFCAAAVERNLDAGGERSALLRKLWQAGTPYIHWRMPWIGYEYWDPEKAENERFLSGEEQSKLIGQAVGGFPKMFGTLAMSACAPGYRADDSTYRAWAQHGMRMVQDGPGLLAPAHFDRHGVLHLARTVEFEPATDVEFSVEACVRQAEACFARGIPAVVSVHSINFHSTVRDFRSSTLRHLNEFLNVLEARHVGLIYLQDRDVLELVQHGAYRTDGGSVTVNVGKKKFIKASLPTWQKQ